MTVSELPMDEHGVPLAQAIAQLRTQLQQAIEDGSGKRLRFVADSVELELDLSLSIVVKAGAKLAVWSVLSAGGSRDRSTTSNHRMRLVLKPRDTMLADGEETLIGDDLFSTD